MRGIKIPQYEFALKMQGGLCRGGRICGTLRYNFVWSPNSYLLQCFQALVHLQGISQHSCSLRSNFIVAETVEEKSIIIHASKLSCDNGLVLIM